MKISYHLLRKRRIHFVCDNRVSRDKVVIGVGIGGYVSTCVNQLSPGGGSRRPLVVFVFVCHCAVLTLSNSYNHSAILII